ncbi:protein SPT2 homolog isoform X1 [Clarias gariepinus]|uniref:protein SPT2 homolog isoform X1 n=1 Tax=Clarias gariepinus TaxID=13013 RepID=UPI00234E2C9A|nr:protein SPT2 homolog isoform X1 [Clarias gariepinus]
MDFHSVLSIASQNQGLSNLPKRYSLKPGPPKKDPRVKGVNSSAVQAYLRKQETEHKKKELEKKRQKDDLLAKRVELKSDRKARAMASRTKDNFHGYNGVPIVEQPKKRKGNDETFEDEPESNSAYDDEDNYEYAETDSESEPEPTTPAVRFQERSNGSTKMSNTQKKNSAPPKAAPPPMNFADLLKLAEKKQFEPVELKQVKKTEERLRTADEIKELEIERKAKKQDKGRDIKPDKGSGYKDSKSSTNSHKKNVIDREGTSHRSSSEKASSGISKTPKLHTQAERLHSSAKSSHGSKPSSSSSGALSGKAAMKGTSALVKQTGHRPQSGGKPNTPSDLNSKKVYPGLPQVKINSSGSRADAVSNSSRPSGHGQLREIKGSGHTRPSQGNTNKKGPPQKPGKAEMPRSVGPPPPRPGINGPMRSAHTGSLRQAESQQPRPGGSMQGRPVPGGVKPSANGQGKPSRPLNSTGPGPGRPPCTVVSETISSKNFAPKQGMPARPPAPQGPKTIIGPTGHRIIARPPGPALPPITSNYKRMHEDEEEYDSEMDDFIDDEGEEQDEISKHIREIFGYDRKKYKDESDYALKFMESSWKDQQKEEARSLRLGIKEDEEEMRMEEEEMKRKLAMKAKRRKT